MGEPINHGHAQQIAAPALAQQHAQQHGQQNVLERIQQQAAQMHTQQNPAPDAHQQQHQKLQMAAFGYAQQLALQQAAEHQRRASASAASDSGTVKGSSVHSTPEFIGMTLPPQNETAQQQVPQAGTSSAAPPTAPSNASHNASLAALQQPNSSIPTPAQMTIAGFTPEAIAMANIPADVKLRLLQQHPDWLERHKTSNGAAGG